MLGRAELTAKGKETRERILAAALGLFRARGFEAATMRDVAAEAGMSLGAAYHYFAGKEAIVLAYYERVQAEHERRVAEVLSGGGDLRTRVATALHLKLDTLREDRGLAGALLRYTGDPDHPLSFLGRGTRELTHRSMAVYADAVGEADVPADLRVLVPVLLWAMQMGLLLYFLYDESAGQARTRALVEGAADLFVSFLKLARVPLFRPIRSKVVALLDSAGLIPAEESIAGHRGGPDLPGEA